MRRSCLVLLGLQNMFSQFLHHQQKVRESFPPGETLLLLREIELLQRSSEDLKVRKENKAKIEAFKIRGVYDLVNVGSEPFAKISVDEVLANLVIEDENDTDNVEQDHEDYEEEVLFVEDYDSDDDYES